MGIVPLFVQWRQLGGCGVGISVLIPFCAIRKSHVLSIHSVRRKLSELEQKVAGLREKLGIGISPPNSTIINDWLLHLIVF